VRGYEKTGRCSFFNKVDFYESLLIIRSKRPSSSENFLHYWGKQRAYWGKWSSSYIVKKCPDNAVLLDTARHCNGRIFDEISVGVILQ
jgi:hypothetical protein